MPPRSAGPERPPRGLIGPALAYLGGAAVLVSVALAAVVRPARDGSRLWPAVVGQLDGLLVTGLIFVTLVHAPMGSFLAMQAFFMATFREASGAVVGLGLVRNLAPLLSGFILTALLAARIVPDLRRRPWTGLDDDPERIPDRDRPPVERPEPEVGRLAAVRLVAAVVAGPILTLWGALVGFFLGLIVSQALLSVAPGIYINKFLEMLEPADAASLLVKSLVFALIGGLLACHEGLGRGDQPAAIRTAAARAIAFSAVGILLCNDFWFTLHYLSGAPFGPALAVR